MVRLGSRVRLCNRLNDDLLVCLDDAAAEGERVPFQTDHETTSVINIPRGESRAVPLRFTRKGARIRFLPQRPWATGSLAHHPESELLPLDGDGFGTLNPLTGRCQRVVTATEQGNRMRIHDDTEHGLVKGETDGFHMIVSVDTSECMDGVQALVPCVAVLFIIHTICSIH